MVAQTSLTATDAMNGRAVYSMESGGYVRAGAQSREPSSQRVSSSSAAPRELRRTGEILGKGMNVSETALVLADAAGDRWVYRPNGASVDNQFSRQLGLPLNTQASRERGWLVTSEHLGLGVAEPTFRVSFEGREGVVRRFLDAAPFHEAGLRSEQLDWDSVHALRILELVARHPDLHDDNILVRTKGGRSRLVCCDGKFSFAPPQTSLADGGLARLLRRGPQVLSPALQAKLAKVDVAAWQEALLAEGLSHEEVSRAVAVFERIRADGFAALLDGAAVTAPREALKFDPARAAAFLGQVPQASISIAPKGAKEMAAKGAAPTLKPVVSSAETVGTSERLARFFELPQLLFTNRVDHPFDNKGHIVSNERRYLAVNDALDKVGPMDLVLGFNTTANWDALVRTGSRLLVIGDWESNPLRMHEAVLRPLIVASRSRRDFLSLLTLVDLSALPENAELEAMLSYIAGRLGPNGDGDVEERKARLASAALRLRGDSRLTDDQKRALVEYYEIATAPYRADQSVPFLHADGEGASVLLRSLFNIFYARYSEAAHGADLPRSGKAVTAWDSSFLASEQAFARLRATMEADTFYVHAGFDDPQMYERLAELAKRRGVKRILINISNIIDFTTQCAGAVCSLVRSGVAELTGKQMRDRLAGVLERQLVARGFEVTVLETRQHVGGNMDKATYETFTVSL